MDKTIRMKIDGKEITVRAQRTGNSLSVEHDGETYTVELVRDEVVRPKPAARKAVTPTAVSAPAVTSAPAVPTAGGVPAPMTGTIKELFVNVGDSVKSGDQIIMMEAMKMDIEVAAPNSGKVQAIFVKPGDSIKENQPMMTIE